MIKNRYRQNSENVLYYITTHLLYVKPTGIARGFCYAIKKPEQKLRFFLKEKPHENRAKTDILTCICRWVASCVLYMSTGSPEGKEAYMLQTE